MIETTRIGKSEYQVSRLGFGCCPMGGHGWGHVDDSEVIEAVRRALDLGINLFDTADVYGFGHSEEVLGRALGRDRTRVVIATKSGVRWDATGKITYDTSPGYIQEALEGSLRRLRVDHIPLYQIHWLDSVTPLAATLEVLCALQRDGKIGIIGCSNFSTQQIREAQQICRVESIQLQFSLACREPEVESLDDAKKHEMSVLTWGSLAQGLFSGKYGRDTSFDLSDRRHRYDNFRGEKLAKNLQTLERVRYVAALYEKTPAQVAIRWLLDDERISVALTGIKRRSQIVENYGAMGWCLDAKHRAWIGGDNIDLSLDTPMDINSRA